MTDNIHAVLLMAYGGPDSLADIPAYLADVMSQSGHSPTPYIIQETTERYRLIGGHSPLLAITQRVAHKVAERLNLPVYVGMRHWSPTIKEMVAQMIADGVQQVTAICMAPHYSSMSIAAYRAKLDEALDALDAALNVTFIEQWYDTAGFLDGAAANVRAAQKRFDISPLVIFTAHSLPTFILERGDPYPEQLQHTARLIAERLGLADTDWTFAYQSAAGGRIPWLGPDLIDEMLPQVTAEGASDVLVAPIGFIAEHLEILYDLDIAAQHQAGELGLHLERIDMPNDSDWLVETLAALVEAHHSPAYGKG